MTDPQIQQHIEEAFGIGMSQVPDEIERLAQLVKDMQARTFLEIGTDRGGTFYLFCKLTAPEGKKISLDLPGGVYGSMAAERAAERNRQMRTWAENVHILEGNSHDAAMLRRVKQILAGEPCDFLFIDGDHTAKGVQRDYEMYGPLVRPGGCIFFHDIVDSENHRKLECFVSEYWQRLDGDKHTIIAGEDWGGIGVLQLPSNSPQPRAITRLLRAIGSRKKIPVT